MKERKSVRYLIYHEYLKAALFPILIVEVMLLLMYFLITSYVEGKSQDTLLGEAQSNISEISTREAKNINQQVSEITRLSGILQEQNTAYFLHPEAYGLPAGRVQFARADNGVTYKLSDNGGSSLWYSSLTPMTPETLKKAEATEALDASFRAVQKSNNNIVGIYFNSFDSMNRYYPFLPDVYTVFDSKMNIPEFNFYYLGDKAHNPDKKPVWTDVYLDPAGQGWMASCVVPVYGKGDFLEGVTGIDITVDKIVTNILNLRLPWNAGAFLVDQNGVIMAMPEGVEAILNLKELRQKIYNATVKQDTLKPEEFNILKNENAGIARQMNDVWTSGKAVSDFTAGGHDYYLGSSAIPETGWRLMMLVDKGTVLEPVKTLNVLTRRAGALAFLMMIVFYSLFFSYLMIRSRRLATRIATPIIHIAQTTGSMTSDLRNMRFEPMAEQEIDEIFTLSRNFSVMAQELSALYSDMENKVKQRTLELTEMYENLQISNQDLENEISERKKTEVLLEQNKADLEKSNADLRNANLQLIHQEKMASIGQLAAGVAHEINNPMGFITSNINQLQVYFEKVIKYLKAQEEILRNLSADAESPLEQAAFRNLMDELKSLNKRLNIPFIEEDLPGLFNETLEGTTRVQTIVQELRTFSRNETHHNLADIHNGIDSVIKMIWNELRYKTTIHREYGELPLIVCNIGQLNQVFMNLLMNAVQAIPDKGDITIRTALEDQHIVISVSDNGLGIPESIQNKIFDPFFTTKEIGKGTGLGLSISYEIIKAHHGSMAVYSVLGEGTTFTIRLPVSHD